MDRQSKEGESLSRVEEGDVRDSRDESASDVARVTSDEVVDDERALTAETSGVDETVLLHREVDVDTPLEGEMQMYRELAEIMEGLFHTLVSKNNDYGSSFIETAEMHYQKTDKFDTRLEALLYQLDVRETDKDRRFVAQAFGEGDKMVDEELFETAIDAAGYNLWKAWAAEHYEGEESAPSKVINGEDPYTTVVRLGEPFYTVRCTMQM